MSCDIPQPLIATLSHHSFGCMSDMFQTLNSRAKAVQDLSKVKPLSCFILGRGQVPNIVFSTPLENSSSPEYSKVQHLFGIAVGLFSAGVGLLCALA